MNPDFKMNNLKAILIDIGSGTRDILLHCHADNLENNPKIVAPTASHKLAKLIKQANKDLKIAGYTMGGGPLAQSLCDHLKKGFKIEIEERPAFTIRNNLEQVKQNGFSIVKSIQTPDFFFDEVEIDNISNIFTQMGADCGGIDFIGLSVQDHSNHNLNQSSRQARFNSFARQLADGPEMQKLIYDQQSIPACFSRMISGVEAIQSQFAATKVLVMDPCMSAIAGCWFDPEVQRTQGPVLYVNFGNGHTLACVMENQFIHAIYEHHTGMIKDRASELANDLIRLVEGNLPLAEVFDDLGHGCKTFLAMPFKKIAKIVVTGPRRHIAKSLGLGNIHQAAPGGDMMMTGPLGLLRGFNLVEGNN
jgi:uncharacterized protein (DUF1786 family)